MSRRHAGSWSTVRVVVGLWLICAGAAIAGYQQVVLGFRLVQKLGELALFLAFFWFAFVLGGEDIFYRRRLRGWCRICVGVVGMWFAIAALRWL